MGSEREFEKEEDDDLLLPGFRFHPTDEELLGFYLRRKVDSKPLSIEIIKEIDIYKYDPWDLPKAITAGEQESFFFCLRGRKYRNSIRPNRVTCSGFWKATGIDKPIYSAGDFIGLKKSLVYYRGSSGKGTKTAWMMHEFRLPPPPRASAAFILDAAAPKHEAEIWTLCRVFQRSASHKIKKPNCSWKATRTKQLPGVDSSLQCRSTNGEGKESVDADLYNENIDPVLGGGYYCDSVHHSPLLSVHHSPLLFHPNLIPSPASTDDLLFSSTGDGNWDELESIMALVADH